MSESALRQATPEDPAPPAPTAGVGLPCERCGTFLQGEPHQVGERQVCEVCAPLLRKELRLYPSWYVHLLGILLNFTLAGVLAAINWKRLGDRVRMRNSLIVAAVGVVWTGVLIAYEPRGGIIINIIATRVAAQALGSVYDKHKREGGARANLLWPLLIIVGLVALVFVVATMYFILTGQSVEE